VTRVTIFFTTAIGIHFSILLIFIVTFVTFVTFVLSRLYYVGFTDFKRVTFPFLRMSLLSLCGAEKKGKL
jgi:hypothetical protein